MLIWCSTIYIEIFLVFQHLLFTGSLEQLSLPLLALSYLDNAFDQLPTVSRQLDLTINGALVLIVVVRVG